MKAVEYIGTANERTRSRRGKVDAWIGQVKEMVRQSRGYYPELNNHTLADVKLVRSGQECRVTLVFRKGDA